MSEIWGVFDCKGRLYSTRDSLSSVKLGTLVADVMNEARSPHNFARIYTAAEVRAILSDMPEAAARFEDSK